MPKLPVISAKDLIKILLKIGFTKISQSGSHIKLRRQVGNRTQTVIVPNDKIIKPGTLRNGILKVIDLTVDDLIKLLK
jgi:predicted RNA binding protein YcfA (HicA-like mRNA interferase family)